MGERAHRARNNRTGYVVPSDVEARAATCNYKLKVSS